MNMLSPIDEKDAKMPGTRFVETEKLSADEVMYQLFPGYQNPDRWMVLSSYDCKNGGSFVKVHGLFNHQKLAENVASTAMNQGYKSKVYVADSRSWLKFPVEGVQCEIHSNAELTKAIGVEIKKDNQEAEKLRRRVAASRGTTPTTAFGRFEQLVHSSAKELLQKLEDGDEKTINLRDKFERFREKELAKIPNPPLDPVLEQHFKKKIASASIQDKKQANAIQSAGMGMPSF